jgi:hypothetical protein
MDEWDVHLVRPLSIRRSKQAKNFNDMTSNVCLFVQHRSPAAFIILVSPHKKYQSAQFSSFKPGTWRKCRMMRVTRVARLAKAMHAVNISLRSIFFSFLS